MSLHIKYNDYIPEIPALEDFDSNIQTPDEDSFEDIKNISLNCLDKIEKEYPDNNLENVHFVYCKYIDSEDDVIIKSLHPDVHERVENQIIYTKFSTDIDKWTEKYTTQITKALEKQLSYDGTI